MNGLPCYLIHCRKASQSEQSTDSPYHFGLVSPSTFNLMKRNCNKLNRGVRPSSDLILKVQKLLQELEEAVTNDKREYEISLSDSRNLATIFKYINCVKFEGSAFPTLLNNGKRAVTDREKADLLNEYFVCLFKSKGCWLKPYNHNPLTDIYYQRLMNRENYDCQNLQRSQHQKKSRTR